MTIRRMHRLTEKSFLQKFLGETSSYGVVSVQLIDPSLFRLSSGRRSSRASLTLGSSFEAMSADESVAGITEKASLLSHEEEALVAAATKLGALASVDRRKMVSVTREAPYLDPFLEMGAGLKKDLRVSRVGPGGSLKAFFFFLTRVILQRLARTSQAKAEVQTIGAASLNQKPYYTGESCTDCSFGRGNIVAYYS
ncbi:hypothetical protein ACH5RR_026685 [Cinchona calisaya]|uniref:Uncharacterized protein n=1 Tax=Cinchona calisaya TaxID=153742 RepID=A0ABD2Z4C3_9GENT